MWSNVVVAVLRAVPPDASARGCLCAASGLLAPAAVAAMSTESASKSPRRLLDVSRDDGVNLKRKGRLEKTRRPGGLFVWTHLIPCSPRPPPNHVSVLSRRPYPSTLPPARRVLKKTTRGRDFQLNSSRTRAASIRRRRGRGRLDFKLVRGPARSAPPPRLRPSPPPGSVPLPPCK